MSDEFELAYFKMRMLQCEIRMNAMLAENKQMKLISDGKFITYVEKDFMNLIEEYGIHHNAFPDYTGR